MSDREQRSLYSALRDVERFMLSINPRLALYKELRIKHAQLLTQIEHVTRRVNSL